MIYHILFLGPPASGKGTQAEKIAKDLSIPHIDTGSLLRESIAEGTKYGLIAQKYIEGGNLAPADVVVGMLKERLVKDDCKKGFVLDGFPRSVEQAELFAGFYNEFGGDNIKQMVINVQADPNVLLDRIVNRRYCKDCGAIYNLKFKPSKVENTCDLCGGGFKQRNDDTEEIAKVRFETYKNSTEPLIEYYKNKNFLYDLDSNKPIDEIFNNLKSMIKDASVGAR